MGRLEKDMADLRTFHAARMSPASIAVLLGRSVKWCEAQLAAAVDVVDEKVDVIHAGAGQVEAAAPPPSAPPPKADVRPAREAEPAPIFCPGRARPVTTATVGFIRRFLAAGWQSRGVAYLFDLSPEDLGDVLEAFA